MKKNILVILLSLVLFNSIELMAQVGNPWLIGGNNLTGNRSIGSNNNFGLSFKTNNIQRGVITNSGYWGINTNAPSPYRLKVSHTSYGLDIENNSTSDDWELYTTGTGPLYLYFNSSFRGQFNSTTGVYSPVSDERLKTNIQPMSPALEKITQLKPSTYQFKNTADKQLYNGFLAQDVMKIFPSLVMHNVNQERNEDVYTLDYSGLGVIAIKGIQELNQTIKQQEQTITTLQDRIAKLEAALDAISNNLNRDTKGVSLQQNQPNPFSQTTIIRYSILQGANAEIRIYDATGRLIKNLRATESGQAQINAYDLSPGTYTYTLIVNGNVAAARKMVLLK